MFLKTQENIIVYIKFFRNLCEMYRSFSAGKHFFFSGSQLQKITKNKQIVNIVSISLTGML